MDDDSHKPGLYRWKRQIDSKVYSRSQKITTPNAVQDWIKKVELASNQAAEAVFGGGGGYGVGRDRGRVQALQTRQQLREHEENHSEAQELLNQWMDEKVKMDDDLDDFTDEPWNRGGLEAEVKREWDYLLENNQILCGDSQSSVRKNKIKDPYADLYEMEDKDAVNTVLHNLMEKEVIKDSFFKTLGQEEMTNRKDPRMKMELRHKQVKENREKRQTDEEKKKREQQAKKTAQFEAKRIILKEEREKSQRIKREEMEVQKEMARIRKEMQDEKRRADEAKQRERRDRERTELMAREELDKQMEEENREREQSHRGEMRRREFMKKMEQLQRRQAAVNLKILQRHFSAWYNVVLERRMQLGKAEALSDWKCILKGWNAWKSYVREHRLERETKRYQTDVKETYRKSQIAEDHHRKTLVRKYFQAWQLWAHTEQDRKELEEAQSNTRNKMMAFLEAAATGKLWENDGDLEGGRTDRHNRGDGPAGKLDSARRKVDEMFAEPPRRRTASLSGASSARSSVSVNEPCSRGKTKRAPFNPRIPTEAWQVTKRHLKLTPDEIASLSKPSGGDVEDDELGDQSDGRKSRKRLGKVPWNIPQMPVNKFEHRHKAQQEILEQQQKQLKEQKRLIEDLQFEQRKQTLQQQAEKQQLTQELLNNFNNIQPVPSQNQQTNNIVQNKENLDNGRSGTRIPESQPSTYRSGATITSSAPHSARSDTSVDPSSTSKTTKSDTRNVSTLKKMEERAAERARMKAEREEKRRIAEEERLVQLQAQEQEILLRQEEEKKARVEAYREKKRLEKQKEQDRLQHMERMRQLNILAEQHFERSLLKYRGILPLKRLVSMAEEKVEIADQHYNESVLRKTFLAWHIYVRDMLKAKHGMVDEMFKYFLVRRCFNNWKNYKNIMGLLEKKAERFYAKNLQYRVLQAWADRAAEEKVAGWEKERRAKQHNEWRMKRNAFVVWQQYPEFVKKEKDREKRKADMRQKVASLLPDFNSSTPRQSLQHV